MTLKLELNDWEALSVEVALVTLQERWMAKSRDGAGAPALASLLGDLRAPALASLQILIDKVWKAKAQQGSLGQFEKPKEGAEVSQKEFRRQMEDKHEHEFSSADGKVSAEQSHDEHGRHIHWVAGRKVEESVRDSINEALDAIERGEYDELPLLGDSRHSQGEKDLGPEVRHISWLKGQGDDSTAILDKVYDEERQARVKAQQGEIDFP